MATTPNERSQRASIAAHLLHAKYDGRKLTEPARTAFLSRFELQVDPEGVLPEDERRRRARHARTAYMRGLALKSSIARRAKSS